MSETITKEQIVANINKELDNLDVEYEILDSPDDVISFNIENKNSFNLYMYVQDMPDGIVEVRWDCDAPSMFCSISEVWNSTSHPAIPVENVVKSMFHNLMKLNYEFEEISNMFDEIKKTCERKGFDFDLLLKHKYEESQRLIWSDIVLDFTY